MRAAGLDGVAGAELGQVPEAGRDRLSRHRLGVGGVAVDLVGQLLIVTIPVGREGEVDDTGVGRVRRHLVGAALVLRPHLVGGQVAAGEAHQALLAGAVDGGELAAVDDVVLVALDRPGRLAQTGEGARRERGVEVEVGGRRLAAVIGVPPRRVRQDLTGGAIRERHGVVVLPGVGQPADVRAVVGVAGGVDDVAHGLDVVGVPVAVRQVRQLTGGPVGAEQALDVGLAAVHGVTRAVEPLVVGLQTHDGPGVAGVAHDRVETVHAHTAVVLQDRHSVAGIRRGIDGGEAAPDGQAVAVRSDCDRHHHAVIDLRGEVRQLARPQVEGGDPLPGLGVDIGEGAPDVEGRAVLRELHGLDRGVGRQAQVPTGAVGGRDRADAIGADVVDLGEAAPEVERGAVGGGLDGAHLAVGRRRPAQQLAGVDVVGHEVGAGLLVLTDGRARGAGRVELPGDVDGVADDLLVPHHAVPDLGGRQGVGGDGLVRLLGGVLLIGGSLLAVGGPLPVGAVLTGGALIAVVGAVLVGALLIARLLGGVLLIGLIGGHLLISGRLTHRLVGTGARHRQQAGDEQENTQGERW